MRRGLAATAALLAALALAASSAADHAPVSTWGAAGSGPGQFAQPAGVAVDSAGNVYVADSLNDRVQKFTADGTFVTAWGSTGSGPGQFQTAQDVAVEPAGTILVADRNNNRVQRFTADGAFVTAWGSGGTGDGQFRHPTGVDADAAGNVYVVEYSGSRVQRFSPSGSFATKWGSLGSAPGQFDLPFDVAVDGAGNVYVVDTGNHRVQKFNIDGAHLATLGGSRGSAPGQFSFGALGAVDVDSAGNVYVSDSDNNRIQVLDPNGTFLEQFGSRGTAPGQFNRQLGVAWAPSGDVYVADRGNQRMQRLAKRPAQAGPPEVGKSVVAQKVSGTVKIRQPGSSRFETLGETSRIPVRSIVDTTRGTVRMTSAKDARGGVQTADFRGGQFQVVQKRSSRPVTDLVMKGGSFRRCPRARGSDAQAAQSRRRVRRLWGNGRGRFRTRGRYSAATVRGTTWEVTDRCDGTLTRVRRGRVAVRDLVRRRTVNLRAGQSYLAKPRGR